MTNRDDFDNVAEEVVEIFRRRAREHFFDYSELQTRIEAELHNAFVAGQESELRDSDRDDALVEEASEIVEAAFAFAGNEFLGVGAIDLKQRLLAAASRAPKDLRGRFAAASNGKREQCAQCGAEILGFHACPGVPGGFGDEPSSD